ncbi:copper chaperone PCu(A)C [Streptomyces rectiverticillatus]|uniref:copper chaperone PCu(A)C n=1 Tax=Streptomyces rectiverticillatus TaxID=173860 RepID=UPI0015C345D4|nr:copper chaperone PCu(A)C [Streptomyces rectiverticillatus]QLE71081.1 copper chaperone PCu(A)C [Streptomyces rectiverticillatus]
MNFSGLTAAGRAALVPVLACAVTLGGLGAWTASGAAGRPPAVTVEDARVLLPLGRDDTAAFFRVRNDGDVDDELVGVDAPTAGGAMLSRTVVKKGAGTMQMVRSVTVPAGGTLEMSPHGLDVMISAPPRLKLGDRLPVVLKFRGAGAVQVEAEVVRPGS